MVLKSVVAGEASVMIDDLRAGRIFQEIRAGHRHVYFWTLSSPYTVTAAITASGEQDTLEDAKSALRGAFDAWLKWALEREWSVVWYGEVE